MNCGGSNAYGTRKTTKEHKQNMNISIDIVINVIE